MEESATFTVYRQQRRGAGETAGCPQGGRGYSLASTGDMGLVAPGNGRAERLPVSRHEGELREGGKKRREGNVCDCEGRGRGIMNLGLRTVGSALRTAFYSQSTNMEEVCYVHPHDRGSYEPGFLDRIKVTVGISHAFGCGTCQSDTKES